MTPIRLPIAPGLIPACALLALSVTLLVVAQDFGRSSGLFPRFIGVIFVALSLAETVMQILRTVRSEEKPFVVDPTSLGRPLLALSWIVSFLVVVFLFGFTIGVPVFIFAFLRLAGKHSWFLSSAIALGSVAFISLIFIQLLSYDLFPGILMP